MSLTIKQEKILELRKQGLKPSEIAIKVGVTPQYTRSVLGQNKCEGYGRKNKKSAVSVKLPADTKEMRILMDAIVSTAKRIDEKDVSYDVINLIEVIMKLTYLYGIEMGKLQQYKSMLMFKGRQK